MARQKRQRSGGTALTSGKHLVSGDPRILGGKPVIKGTRMPASLVVGSVGGGMTVDEVMHEYRLTRAQVLAALTYACRGRRRGADCSRFFLDENVPRRIADRLRSEGTTLSRSERSHFAQPG